VRVLLLVKGKGKFHPYSVDPVFNELGDRIQDNQVQGIQSLEISVGQVIAYRLMMVFPMLIKLLIYADI
jgi:hypothetical protein